MPSSVVRPPTREDAKVRSEQELEFDRWRIAVDIVKRIREAGISANYLTVSKTDIDRSLAWPNNHGMSAFGPAKPQLMYPELYAQR